MAGIAATDMQDGTARNQRLLGVWGLRLRVGGGVLGVWGSGFRGWVFPFAVYGLRFAA